MSSRKRSLSPTGRPNTKDRSFSTINGIKRMFGFFSAPLKTDKKVMFKQNYDLGDPDSNASNKPHFDFSSTDKDILSDKRRRISVQQSNEFKGFVPRGSVDVSGRAISKYGDYLHKIHQQSDEVASSLERRASLLPQDLVEDSGEYNSPIPDMNQVRGQSIQMINALQKTEETTPELESMDDQSNSVDSTNVGANELDFAPLYKDEEGNLVRPPFINLAPKERYQLIELKKSLEVSRAIQSRLKYTINPHETTSILMSDNKVETGTQTQNLSYLRKKLHYNAFIDRREDGDSKRKKLNNGAMFSGEFLYELDDFHDKQNQENKYNGYLGSISKPKVNEDKNERKEFTSDSSVQLDSEYVSKKEKLSEKIKIKDDEVHDKSTIKPSQGFSFSINKTDLNRIINKNDEVDTTESQKVGQKVGQKSEQKSQDVPKEAPKFSFGSKKSDSEEPSFSFLPKKDVPSKVSFGDSMKENKPPVDKPTVFSFGAAKKDEKKEAPSFSFGAAKNEEKKEAPSFSFGGSTEKKGLSIGSKPSSFALSTEDEEPRRKIRINPVVLNTEQKETPKFNFGASTKETSSKDEGKTTTPAFSFGSTNKVNEEKAKPVLTPSAPSFSFGSSTEKKTPAFSFGKKDDTPESKPETTESKPEATEAPKFSFGASTTTNKPAFNFGTASKTEDKAVPQFSFGGSKPEDKPKFSFGSTEEKKETTPASAASDSKFTFGAGTGAAASAETPKSDTLGSKATSLFGTIGTTSTAPTIGIPGATGATGTPGATANPGFPISSTTSATKETSPFNFGATEKPSFKATTPATDKPETKPTFDFGATSKPSFNFGATQVPSFSASVPPTSTTSPFQFGAIAPPKLQTASPFNREGTPDGKTAAPAPANVFGNVNTENKFQFANGITPIKPPGASFGGFNRENTPSQFNFSRSTSGTPEFNAFGQQSQTQPQQAFGQFGNANMGSNMTPMGLSNSAPIGITNGITPVPGPGMTPGMTPGASPMNGANPTNRPNRKIARMRKRRT